VPNNLASPAPRRIPSLDGLRTLSIVMVLLGHLYGTAHYPFNRFTRYLAGLSHLGVAIFFVISGFLITSLLLKEKTRTGRIQLGQFYKRRTLRIFPAAFTYITVMALVARPGFLIYAYAFLFSYVKRPYPWVLGHLWSLSVEEQFYLLWPAVLVLAFRWRKQAALIAILLCPMARFLFVSHGMPDIDRYFPAVADNLVMGCLLAMYYDDLRRHAAWLTRWWSLAGLAVLVLGCWQEMWKPWFAIGFAGLVPLFIALFTFAAVERADRFLNNPVTAFLGLLSYSIYLWQGPFLNFTSRTWWTAFPVNLLLTSGCALCSYYLVESPFLRLYRAKNTTPAEVKNAPHPEIVPVP
jgi:peptidoglycan/LPS O-acetylase OafA/YrhL